MRRVLQLLGTSALRLRIGVAVVLAIVVFGVVGVARVLSGPEGRPVGTLPPANTSPAPLNTDPAAADDGVVETQPATAKTVDPGPSLSPGALGPIDVAKDFANSWLDRTAQAEDWHAALVPNTTADLAAKLKDVDPIVVPAKRLTGPATVEPQGAGLVQVSYPVDSGTLILRLIVTKGRWLVDGVDWERA